MEDQEQQSKVETFACRCTKDEKALIHATAKKLGLSAGEFITRLVKRVQDEKEILNSLLPRI